MTKAFYRSRSFIIGLIVIAFIAIGLGIHKMNQSPNPDRAALADIRPDLQELLLAIAYRIQGIEMNMVGMTAFDESVGSLADPTGLQYDHLYLQNVALKRFEQTGENRFELVAIYHFADKMRKRAFVTVGVEYFTKGPLTYVVHAVAEPFYAAADDVVIVAAPTSFDIGHLNALKQEPLEEIYLKMLKNALPTDIVASHEGPLMLLLVNRTRKEKNTMLDVFIPGENTAKIYSSAQLNQDGWAYTLVEADFNLTSEQWKTFVTSMRDVSAHQVPPEKTQSPIVPSEAEMPIDKAEHVLKQFFTALKTNDLTLMQKSVGGAQKDMLDRNRNGLPLKTWLDGNGQRTRDYTIKCHICKDKKCEILAYVSSESDVLNGGRDVLFVTHVDQTGGSPRITESHVTQEKISAFRLREPLCRK